LTNQNGVGDNVASGALHRVWPLAAIGVVLAINLAWIGAIAYAIYRLF
jgi:hypothetical protein